MSLKTLFKKNSMSKNEKIKIYFLGLLVGLLFVTGVSLIRFSILFLIQSLEFLMSTNYSLMSWELNITNILSLQTLFQGQILFI